jgi:2-oxoglutarate ferredoxin oxidoreductase subunit alpha
LPPIAVAHRGHHSKIDTLARNDTDLAAEVEHYHTEDAKVVVVAYGPTSRTALLAINKARRATKKVGLLRLITQSPFPAREIGQLKAEKIIIPETDHGQVERLVREHTSSPIIVLHHAAGMSFSEDEIYEALEKS